MKKAGCVAIAVPVVPFVASVRGGNVQANVRSWLVPRWTSRRLGLRRRVGAAFIGTALVLTLATAAVVWGISRAYLIEVRQQTGIRQAQASAAAVQRLLAPQDADLPQQAQQLAGINESGVLVTRGGDVLTAVGLAPEQVPPQLRRLVESGTSARQRVRIDGEVRLIVGIPLVTGASYYQSLTFQRVDAALRALSATLIGTGIAGVLLSALWARAAVHRSLRPVEELTAAAQAMAHGQLTVRMPEDDPDLAPIARAFNSTTAALERRVRSDARFASNVSHELRTPLTTMTNAVAVLDRRRPQLSGAASEALALLSSEIRRFERLVLDLLDIARVTEGGPNLTLEQVLLPDLVRDLAAAEGWGPVEVRDEGLPVAADRRRLARVLSNLVINARTHGGGLVRLAVRRQGDSARIEVDDAGPGVPADVREQIFERFVHRPTQQGGRDGGAGLGLALVAELTALHRGRVWVEDRPDGGARFILELPLAGP